MLKLNEAVLAAAAAAAAAAGDTSLRYDCGYEGGPVCAPSKYAFQYLSLPPRRAPLAVQLASAGRGGGGRR